MRVANKYTMEDIQAGFDIMVSKQVDLGSRDDLLQVACKRSVSHWVSYVFLESYCT